VVGKALAHYKIVEKIGAGGVGEVYRATDSKLGRDVALKMLPEAFAQDAERMARFQREAQVLASLNHPNIGAIYGFEEADSTKALVLELVEGRTLADRIRSGPAAPDEALPIARQIAEALESAHEKGIIHRDLKPSRIRGCSSRARRIRPTRPPMARRSSSPCRTRARTNRSPSSSCRTGSRSSVNGRANAH
jgi:serine/threonine protein kinase